jgi:hypothetical protein
LPDLASDLVRSNVAVIVAWTTLGVRAAKLATTTTPIVIAGAVGVATAPSSTETLSLSAH